MISRMQGFLLTRSWRDTRQGIELTLWGSTSEGPLRIVMDAQEAVCFIERGQSLTLPAGARRRELALATMEGRPVDGLYFASNRDLQSIRHGAVPLYESDVKPADRFLMERFIRAGFEVSGEREREADGWLMRNPAIRSADVSPSLRTVALDIETRGTNRDILSIAGAQMEGGRQDHGEEAAIVYMLGQGESEQRDGYVLHYRRTERELLASFFAWISAIDPDVITGWSVVNFDLDTIERRCLASGLPFRLGRGIEVATVLQPSQRGSPKVARVPGRAVLDGIDLLKASFRAFESYSLENVSNVLLGTGKLITPEQDKLAEIHRMFRDDRPRLADYNLRDCTLVNEILTKTDLIDFAAQRARLTGLSIERLAGATAAFDNLYLPRLHRAGHVAPDIDRRDDAPGGPGGHVMESVPGLYDDVLVLDFKSLYPSIIRTFFIDPLGMAQGDRAAGEGTITDHDTDLVDDLTVPGFLGARFVREGHILPAIVNELWEARDAAKAARDAPLSQAIKIIMNSFYGIFGTTGCRFYSERLVSSITRRGQEIITETRVQVENLGHQVIYGDTDSLFIVLRNRDEGSVDLSAAGRDLVTLLNDYWQRTLQQRHALVSRLELEYETHYERFLMPTVRGMPTGSKKRYAGLVRDTSGEARLVVKGLEAVRSDWTPLARDFQRELFRRVFLDLDWEAHVRQTVAALRAGELDASLAYRKRLRRDVSDYQRSVPPHVRAARKLTQPGRWIRYVMTLEGPEPVEAMTSRPDHEHYLEKQLAPAADGILRFLDTSFAEITDAQLRMF